MSFVKFKSWLAGLVTVGLVACGGGGSSGDQLIGGGTGTGSGGTSSSGPSVTVSLSSATVTAATPATVTVTVRDSAGAPIAGSVVDLNTSRGTLAGLAVTSVATDRNGVATTLLSAKTGGLSGADQVVASAKLGTTTVQGTATFTVVGSAPTLSLSIAPSTTIRESTGKATVNAIVRDAAGVAVSGAQVNFSASAGLVSLDASSALTDSAGAASITVFTANPSVTAADTLVASATVGTVQVQGSLVVQLVADKPSIVVAPSSSSVTAASPATLRMTVKDTSNTPVGAGVIVSVSSSFGLTAFDAVTAATDSNGVATVVATPKTATSNGADQVVASATVGGVSTTASVVLQVSSSSTTSPPTLQTVLSSPSISSASPGTVTAVLKDGRGQAVAGQVVTFSVVRGLGKTNIATALTNASGAAVVVLVPSSSSAAGADEVVASASYAGTSLTSSNGFQVQATDVQLTSLTPAVPALGAYGQTTLTLALSGASVGAPVNVSVTSSCVSLGKATLSPVTFQATTNSVSLQYKDAGCGALQVEDKIQATITGTAASASLSLPIATPSVSSLAFVSASPEVIYIKGSGFTESSTLTFEVRDGAGNVLPNRSVKLSLLTQTGGATIEGGIADVTQVSDASGRVAVRVNSGTMPTPIRVAASLSDVPSIATVSSNLSVAVGLPSQLNFSISQQTRNIEGMNIDGTTNTYSIFAADRSGNPVPVGTSINFVTEGGQIESIKQTQLVSGLAKAVANFVSADPRPADGRVTITAYALGEESFIDQNGNNVYDAGEPFQDLGNVHKDRNFDGSYVAALDEYVPTNISNSSACVAPSGAAGATPTSNAILALNASIPSVAANTCDGRWSGAGQVYVRRAAETVLSTSAARALWASTSGLDAGCASLITLQVGPQGTDLAPFTPVSGGDRWYTGSVGTYTTTLPITVADANSFPIPYPPSTAIGRLNPMAAGTLVSATTSAAGVKLTIGGSPVANTTEATAASVTVDFDPTSSPVTAAVLLSFTSPSGLITSYAVTVNRAAKPSACPH